MRLPAANEERTAVLFMEDGKITRQMLHSEFEAILDHFVPIMDFAGKRITAVYVDINGELDVTATVFFLVNFGADGLADENWNIPLKLLASQGSSGPDMGSGPVRLVCRNRCPVAWHQAQLWDPPLGDGANAFTLLSNAVRENRLRLPKLEVEKVDEAQDHDDSIPTLYDDDRVTSRSLAAGDRLRAARSLKSLRLRISLLKSEHEDHLVRLHCKHRDDLDELGKTCTTLEEKMVEERKINEHLKQCLDKQAEDFKNMRILISSQIGKIEHGELLGKQLGEEFDLRLNAITAELQEQLERKDMELDNRDGDITRLQESIHSLGEQKRELQDKAAGGDFLRSLSAAGISYIACQPGAGEFRVPQQDIATYLESPLEYAARYCYVDIELYKIWLAHHEKPRCSKDLDDGGKVCGMPVHRVEAPATFEPGESDRCSQHRDSSLTLSRVMHRAG